MLTFSGQTHLVNLFPNEYDYDIMRSRILSNVKTFPNSPKQLPINFLLSANSPLMAIFIWMSFYFCLKPSLYLAHSSSHQKMLFPLLGLYFRQSYMCCLIFPHYKFFLLASYLLVYQEISQSGRSFWLTPSDYDLTVLLITGQSLYPNVILAYISLVYCHDEIPQKNGLSSDKKTTENTYFLYLYTGGLCSVIESLFTQKLEVTQYI